VKRFDLSFLCFRVKYRVAKRKQEAYTIHFPKKNHKAAKQMKKVKQINFCI